MGVFDYSRPESYRRIVGLFVEAATAFHFQERLGGAVKQEGVQAMTAYQQLLLDKERNKAELANAERELTALLSIKSPLAVVETSGLFSSIAHAFSGYQKNPILTLIAGALIFARDYQSGVRLTKANAVDYFLGLVRELSGSQGNASP